MQVLIAVNQKNGDCVIRFCVNTQQLEEATCGDDDVIYATTIPNLPPSKRYRIIVSLVLFVSVYLPISLLSVPK